LDQESPSQFDSREYIEINLEDNKEGCLKEEEKKFEASVYLEQQNFERADNTPLVFEAIGRYMEPSRNDSSRMRRDSIQAIDLQPDNIQPRPQEEEKNR